MRRLYPEWLTSLGIFLFLTLVAIVLTLWNFRPSGENVQSGGDSCVRARPPATGLVKERASLALPIVQFWQAV